MGKRNRRRSREAKEAVQPGMSAEQIKAAGLAVDLPFEAPTSDDLEYDDGVSLTDEFPELLEPDLGGPRDGD